MPRAIPRNKFDHKDSLELGTHAEELFTIVARGRGWKVLPSSKDENIDEHWDFLIEKDHRAFRVEVKSRKRIRREDGDTQSFLTWIELHGVRPRDRGWLFGKADLIAFEKPGSFLLVKRTALLAVVNRKVDLEKKVIEPGQAVYGIYTRRGRKDKLTLLPFDDIESIKFNEWEKLERIE